MLHDTTRKGNENFQLFDGCQAQLGTRREDRSAAFTERNREVTDACPHGRPIARQGWKP